MENTVTITQEQYDYFMELDAFVKSFKKVIGVDVKIRKVRKPKQNGILEKFKNHRFTTRVDIDGNEIHPHDYAKTDRFYILRAYCDSLPFCKDIYGEIADIQLDVVDKRITVSIYTDTSYGTELENILEYTTDEKGIQVLNEAIAAQGDE